MRQISPVGIQLRRVLEQWRSILTVSTGMTLLTSAFGYIGGLQGVELSFYDAFMRLRPSADRDERIVLVTVNEADLERLQHWPISDFDLARAIEAIAAQKPSAIGLNIYRNLPVQPGHALWRTVAHSTDNLIGVYKLGIPRVEAPEALAEVDRAAFSDLPIDFDRRQRRAMLSLRANEMRPRAQLDLPDDIQLSFAMQLSLLHLERDGLLPDLSAASAASPTIAWGEATFRPLLSYGGGYASGRIPGYQILLDYRGVAPETFSSISLARVLEGDVPADLFRDRVVILGTTAVSLDARWHTPFSYSTLDNLDATPSLYVHANIVSQILSAVLDGRNFLQAAKPTQKFLWLWSWTIVFHSLCVAIACASDKPHAKAQSLTSQLAFGAVVLSGRTIATSYGAFLMHLWLPTFSPIASGMMASLAVLVRQRNSFARLATTDDLTQLANRRYFDEFIERSWKDRRMRQEISLLLCDVDFFKRYNDTYGHQAGDVCLSSVARAMSNAVRSNDLVARYGGEEFAIVMPGCPLEVAERVAERMCQAVRDLSLDHQASDAAPHVTISCGIASTSLGVFERPEELIEEADRALYLAKKEGRNCYRVLVSLDIEVTSSPSPTTDLPAASETDDDPQPA